MGLPLVLAAGARAAARGRPDGGPRFSAEGLSADERRAGRRHVFDLRRRLVGLRAGKPQRLQQLLPRYHWVAVRLRVLPRVGVHAGADAVEWSYVHIYVPGDFFFLRTVLLQQHEREALLLPFVLIIIFLVLELLLLAPGIWSVR